MSNLPENIAKAGTLICVGNGLYSDYTVMGFFVALQDFEPYAVLKVYLADNPEQNYEFDPDQFLANLLSKGLLLEVKYGSLHLTNYLDPDEFRFTPA